MRIFSLTKFILTSPRVGGIVFLLLALWMGTESEEESKKSREFAGAARVTTVVILLEKAPSALPRWHATVQWHEGCLPPCQAVVTIGTKGKKHMDQPAFNVGQELQILVHRSDPTKVIPYSKALDPSASFWDKSPAGGIALILGALGIIFLLFPDAVRRQAAKEMKEMGESSISGEEPVPSRNPEASKTTQGIKPTLDISRTDHVPKAVEQAASGGGSVTACPACRRNVQDGLVECPFCGVIFAKWRGPTR